MGAEWPSWSFLGGGEVPQGAAWSQPLRPWVLSLLTCTIGARMLGLGKAASPEWGSHSSPQNEKGEWESPLGGSEDTSNTTNSVVVSPGCQHQAAGGANVFCK